MVQLWFSTWIQGITSPAVTDVKSTQVSNFPKSVKNNIATDITNKKLEKLWRLSTKTNLDSDIVWLSLDLMQKLKDGNTIYNEYSSKVPVDVFKSVWQLTKDIEDWYKINEIKDAYKEFNWEMLEDIYDWYKSIHNDSNMIESIAWWIVSKIPKSIWNILSLAMKKSINLLNPLDSTLLDMAPENIKKTVKKYNPYTVIQDIVSDITMWETSEENINKTAEFITSITDELWSDLNRFIWWNDEDVSYKVWEILVEIAPFLINPNIWAEQWVSKVTSKISEKIPSLTKLLSNKFIQRALQRTVESVPNTAISTVVAKWETPSLWEYWAWALLQNVIWSKNVRKSKRLTNIIWEKTNAANLEEWALWWYLEDLPSLKDKVFWRSNFLKPSPKSESAMNLIKNEIKWYATQPPKLLSQITDRIDVIAKELKNKLVNVNTKWLTKMKSTIVRWINTVAEEASNYSTPIAKNIKKITKNIQLAQNMNDIWDSAKMMDRLIPKSIKTSVWKWWKDELLYIQWRKAREAINTAMEEFSYTLPEWEVKTALNKMATYYHAQSRVIDNLKFLYKPVKWAVQEAKELWWVAAKRRALWQIFGINKTDKTEQ